VAANLFSHAGIPLTEAMAFGIGGGLFFGIFPFIKVNYLPLITYRKFPSGILSGCAKRLGVKFVKQKFKSPDRAMAALDQVLASGRPVGLQTGVFWLPYFPPALRFHFNAHNLVVFGKEGSDYLISDPVFEEPVVCSREDLAQARFAKGSLAPKGLMYYLPEQLPAKNIEAAIGAAAKKGIKETARTMSTPGVPLIGFRGIRYLAGAIQKWHRKLEHPVFIRHMGHVVRMQEEIGTGGGGFRFLYGAFLQELSELLNDKRLEEVSGRMTAAGDLWRQFALRVVKVCKGAEYEALSQEIDDLLFSISETEKDVLARLKKCLAAGKTNGKIG
jgi:hypothetical protein